MWYYFQGTHFDPFPTFPSFTCKNKNPGKLLVWMVPYLSEQAPFYYSLAGACEWVFKTGISWAIINNEWRGYCSILSKYFCCSTTPFDLLNGQQRLNCFVLSIMTGLENSYVKQVLHGSCLVRRISVCKTCPVSTFAVIFMLVLQSCLSGTV